MRKKVLDLTTITNDPEADLRTFNVALINLVLLGIEHDARKEDLVSCITVLKATTVKVKEIG